MKFSFEVPFAELEEHMDEYVSGVFSSLESEFLIMPRGLGFIDYPMFEQGYEALKQATGGFVNIAAEPLLKVVLDVPIALIIIRTILGFTPPEWAYIATERTGVEVTQGFARSLDRSIRMSPSTPLVCSGTKLARVKALIEVACQLLGTPAPAVGSDKIHRLDKADTRGGVNSIRALADIGIPYAMLLYERFLGRPFAGHRDSVSELIGDSLESAIEDVLAKAGISYRKTKRAERIVSFDQAPDFIIPSEFNPQVVIEAKITEDDGTARDKVTRIQHLASLSTIDQSDGSRRFEVIACIGGRGFGVRREDMKKLLLATKGKVFTLRTLDKLVEFTQLKEFKSR